MQKSQFPLYAVALAMLVSACSPVATPEPTKASTQPPVATTAPTQVPPTLAPTETTVPPTATPLPLDAALLKNSTYELYVVSVGLPVQLVDGQYTADPLSVHLLDTMAFGDANGDGAEDAAVLLAENSGGTGTFVSLLLMLNQNGQPVQAAAAIIGDRPNIQTLTMQGDQITLFALMPGPNDPACCPSMPMTLTHQFMDGKLILTSLATQTPTGAERRITLDSPTMNMAPASPLLVKGSVTIAPFENVLTYRFYDADGLALEEGPVSVTAPDLGAPGTFETSLEFPAGAVRLEIIDVSAADGSYLALAGMVFGK